MLVFQAANRRSCLHSQQIWKRRPFSAVTASGFQSHVLEAANLSISLFIGHSVNLEFK